MNNKDKTHFTNIGGFFELMSRSHLLILVLMAVAVYFAPVGATQHLLSDLEKQYASLIAESDSLSEKIHRLVIQSDSLALIISKSKQGNGLSYFERKKIESLLKASQRLGEEQEIACLLQSRLQDQMTAVGSVLDSLYSNSIDSIMQVMARPGENENLKKELAEKVGILRIRQQRLKRSQTTLPLSAENIGPVLESNDMPREIEAKADFYRDRGDIYRQKAGEIEHRIGHLKNETKLRRRMAEMVDDIRLFDQRDEPFAASSTNDNSDGGMRMATPDDIQDYNEYFYNADGMKGVGNTLRLYEVEQLMNLDFHALPHYDAEEYISRLETEKLLLLDAADSLSTIARSYEEKAKELRQSLDTPDR